MIKSETGLHRINTGKRNKGARQFRYLRRISPVSHKIIKPPAEL